MTKFKVGDIVKIVYPIHSSATDWGKTCVVVNAHRNDYTQFPIVLKPLGYVPLQSSIFAAEELELLPEAEAILWRLRIPLR